MNASELRIGNLIYKMKLNVNSGIYEFPVTETDYHILFELINGNHKEQIQPIPLTEEWLLKFGFIKTPTRYYIGELNELSNRDLDLILCTSENVISYRDYLHPILYVHQLQNLYFALTGKELEIKL